MNILVPLIGLAAAGAAFVMGKGKKEKPTPLLQSSGEVILTPSMLPEGTPGFIVESAQTAAQTGIPMSATGKVPTSQTVSPTLANLPNLQTSAGWPSIIPQAGPTSGAVSVSNTGAVDDAFDELLARALATQDLAQLRNLAMQAQYRGMTDIAESIRQEIARLTVSAPEPTPIVIPIPVSAPVSTPLGRATISMAAGSKGADVVEWQRIIGAKQDGIFGPITHSLTVPWQKAHGLVGDGIVGPKTWAAAYSLQPTLSTTPRPAVVVTTSTARPTIKRGSTGPAVIEWQGVIGVKQDGIFGPITESITKTWQKSKGLVADGIVGPKTWAAAYATAPSLSVTTPPAIAPQTTTSTHPTIKRGSTGAAVREWQGIIGVTVDGNFGPITESATKTWQKARGLVADGIVGPKTWAAVTVVPTTIKAEPVVAAVESDIRKAARELTEYLQSIGGLAGRGREDKTRIKGWMTRLGVTPDGMYGRGTAGAVVMQGFVPVVPYYWPSTNTAAAKTQFRDLIANYMAADPMRKAQWEALIADVARS